MVESTHLLGGTLSVEPHQNGTVIKYEKDGTVMAMDESDDDQAEHIVEVLSKQRDIVDLYNELTYFGFE